jgi:LPXTG-motif cell wall-anchored protein
LEQEFDRVLVNYATSVMNKHKELIEKTGKHYSALTDIEAIQKQHHYLRYDYITEAFCFYKGREKCYQQIMSEQTVFVSLMEDFYDHMYYEPISPASEISVTGGKITIVGLDADTYYLLETEAPQGYHKLADPVAVPIIDRNLEAIVSGDVYQSGGVRVQNSSGTVLPNTGAEGTVMFVTFGFVVMMATGVLLVTRKRMTMIEE